MVADGHAYATLIDANEAAVLQKGIREMNLRLVRLIEKALPYLVYIYTDNSNAKQVKSLMTCLRKLSQNNLEMIHSMYIPNIQYTTMELNEAADVFIKPPYIGSIILGIIGILSVAGILVDSLKSWTNQIKHKKGEFLYYGFFYLQSCDGNFFRFK